MNLINLKTAAAILGAAAVTGTTTYLVQEREAERLRTDYQTLNQTHAKLANDQQEALAMIQLRDEQIERLKRDVADLPRLRGEVDGLRRQTNELAEIRSQGELLRQENAKLREQLATEELESNEPAPTPWKFREPRRLSEMKDVGRATPEAAMETILWAAANGQFGKVAEMVHLPEEFLETARQEGRLAEVTAQLGAEAYRGAKRSADLSGEADGQVWLESPSGTSDSSARTRLRTTGPDGRTYEYDNVVNFHLTGSPEPSNPSAARFNDYYFSQTDDGWKLVIPRLSPENPRMTD